MFNVKWFNSKAGASGAFAGKLSQPTTQLRQQWEIDAQNADIDLNNPSSMLRYVISQMAEMRGQLKALQPTSREPQEVPASEAFSWHAARSWLVQSEEAATRQDLCAASQRE